jgi:hypothetical protein
LKGRFRLISILVALGLAAAAGAILAVRDPGPKERAATAVGPALPPSPASWPDYPSFSPASCWTRPFGEGVMRSAPSFAARPGAKTAPAELVRDLLARLGDRRYVKRIEIGAPPPVTLQHIRGYFAGERPPANAHWAYIAAPAASANLGEAITPRQVGDRMLAQWEADLVAGALRDDFCRPGGAPLVGMTIGRGSIQISDRMEALGQRFPNPAPTAFRERVAAVGRQYGFRVIELRLLRPRELAPLLVVETSHDRKEFVSEVPAIVSLLNPAKSEGSQTAVTFEGFFLEVRDADGPFVRTMTVRRGQVMGGQWSWDRCVYPYAHSQPVGAPPCP